MSDSTFTYTYSAKKQEEVEAIKNKYVAKEETPIERLHRLDKSAERPGTIVSIIIGIIGTLVMGTGMSMTMVGPNSLFFVGIVIGVMGMIVVSISYPLYKRITKKERAKIAPEIIALSEQILR